MSHVDLPRGRLPSQQIGDYSITAISDGYLGASLDFLANITPTEAARLQLAAGISNPASIHINCYLVRGRGRTILIDAGAGGFKQWGGELLANLAVAGVKPGEIDTILLTHAHPDHIGGLLNAVGEMAFVNAELVVHERELMFWEDDGHLGQASERARGNFLFARRVFERYRKNLRPFTVNDVLPGISAMPLPGHTVGHCGYCFESGGGQPAGVGRYRSLSSDSDCPPRCHDCIRPGPAAIGGHANESAGCCQFRQLDGCWHALGLAWLCSYQALR